MAAVIFSALLFLSASLNLWQWWVGRRFPLHRRRATGASAPPVTLLKPMKGADEWTVRCLESWLSQNYSGPLQVIVGLGSNDDAARPLVEALLPKFPSLTFMICPPGAAPNAKAAKLELMIRQ